MEFARERQRSRQAVLPVYQLPARPFVEWRHLEGASNNNDFFVGSIAGAARR
jgi:hypothetical protein